MIDNNQASSHSLSLQSIMELQIYLESQCDAIWFVGARWPPSLNSQMKQLLPTALRPVIIIVIILPPPTSSQHHKHIPLLTRELQSKALLAGKEVCGKLQADSVKSAVGIRGQRWATQLSQQDPPILGPIPDAKHIVHLLRVENQEMETVKKYQID